MKRAVWFLAVATLGCAPKSPPLVAVPNARVVVSAADAGVALTLWDALARVGLIDPNGDAARRIGEQRSLLSGRPAVASVLDSGAVVVATRAPAAARLAGGDTVLGKVKRLPQLGPDAMVRLDGDRALIGLAGDTDATSLAGLLEALATTDPPPPSPALVPDGALHVRLSSVGPLALGDSVELTVRVSGDDIAIDEVDPVPARPVLDAPTPPWACSFTDAALVLSIPPLTELSSRGVPSDSFLGRVIVALYPSADAEAGDPRDPLSYLSLVASGVPRDAAAARDLFESARAVAGKDATVTSTGSRNTLSVDGKRKLRVVTDDGLFVLGLGAEAPTERVARDAACAGRRTPLLSASGARLAQVVLPALVTPDVVMKTLGGMSVDEALPLARLRGIERVTVDASPRISARIHLAVPQ